MKLGVLLEMPHVLHKQSYFQQAYAISQGRWKNTNGWAGEDKEGQSVDKKGNGEPERISVL